MNQKRVGFLWLIVHPSDFILSCVREFLLTLGRMGSHQNRKGDALPGWITLWRGWTELVTRVDAIRNDKITG